MAQAKGSNLQLMLIEESTWGTTPGTPSGYVIPISSLGGSWYSRNLIDNPELRGSRNPSAPVRGNVAVNGSFTAPLHLDAVGWILKHAIGTPDTTGSSPYTHVSKVNYSGSTAGEDLPVGLTIEHNYSDIGITHVFTGCRVNSLGITATSEGVAAFEVGVVGKGMTDGTTSLDTSPTEYTSTAIDHFAAAIQEGGSATAIVTDVSINLSNNLDSSGYVVGGSGQLGALPSGVAAVTGSLTALFESQALLDKGIDFTESSLKLTWTSGADSLELFVPELVYEPSSPAVSGPAGVRVSMNFRGYYANGADATALKATLVNTTASY